MSAPKNFERMACAHPNGGFLFLALTEEEAAVQRKAVWDMVNSFGKNLVNQKNLTNISFPVTVFEPRSYLERLVDGWWGAPHFLKHAADAKDPVERFKWVITFAIAGFHNTCAQMKPFNPILGETHQASFGDGTQIYCEQSSHHPPVTNFLVVGPEEAWKFYGFGEWHASFRVNTVKGHQRGPHFVEFPDGTVITYNLPWMNVHGIIYGERIIEYEGVMEFRDEKHGLSCDVEFNPKEAQSGGFFSWFSKGSKVPTDYFKGQITRTEGGLRESSGKKEKGSTAEVEQITDVQGSWLGAVEFGDGDRLWDFQGEYKTYEPQRTKTPLPSDCRFRDDVRLLGEGDIEHSQEAKHKLEEKQRYEAKLRKEGEKEVKKKLKKSKKAKDGEGAKEPRIFKKPEISASLSDSQVEKKKKKKKSKKEKSAE